MEYLSEGLSVPSAGFEEDIHLLRCVFILWNYKAFKSKKVYVSDNDYPPRLRLSYVPLLDESKIFSLE